MAKVADILSYQTQYSFSAIPFSDPFAELEARYCNYKVSLNNTGNIVKLYFEPPTSHASGYFINGLNGFNDLLLLPPIKPAPTKDEVDLFTSIRPAQSMVQFDSAEDKVDLFTSIRPAQSMVQFDSAEDKVDLFTSIRLAQSMVQFDSAEDKVDLFTSIRPAQSMVQFDSAEDEVDFCFSMRRKSKASTNMALWNKAEKKIEQCLTDNFDSLTINIGHFALLKHSSIEYEFKLALDKHKTDEDKTIIKINCNIDLLNNKFKKIKMTCDKLLNYDEYQFLKAVNDNLKEISPLTILNDIAQEKHKGQNVCLFFSKLLKASQISNFSLHSKESRFWQKYLGKSRNISTR